MENQFDKIITEIAYALNDIIPTQWDHLFFYGEVSCNKSDHNIGLFFFDSKKNKYVDCSNIPDIYPDFYAFFTLFDRINTLVLDLYDAFVENRQRPWEAILIELEKKGKMKVKFSYDWFSSELNQFGRKIVWANENFGFLPPEDSYAKRILDEYKGE